MSFAVKAVKGVGKAISGIAKGLVKVVKKVASSKIGKIALMAGAMYLTGGAAGMWTTPFASINGALVGAGSAGGTSLSSALLSGNAVAGAGGGVAGAIAGTGSAITGAGGTVAGTSLGAGTGGGIISNAFKGVTGFIKANPMASAMALNAASSALSPDEIDLEQERNRLKLEEEQAMRDRIAKNLNVSGVNLGISPSNNKVLYDNQGNPVYDPSSGIINQKLST